MRRVLLNMLGVGLVVAVFGSVPYELEADQEAREGSSDQRAQKLQQVLQLSDAQEAQMQQITQAYQAQRQQLKNQIAALQQEEDEKIKSVLTSEQQARFDQLKQWRAKRHDDWKREQQTDGQGFGHRHRGW